MLRVDTERGVGQDRLAGLCPTRYLRHLLYRRRKFPKTWSLSRTDPDRHELEFGSLEFGSRVIGIRVTSYNLTIENEPKQDTTDMARPLRIEKAGGWTGGTFWTCWPKWSSESELVSTALC